MSDHDTVRQRNKITARSDRLRSQMSSRFQSLGTNHAPQMSSGSMIFQQEPDAAPPPQQTGTPDVVLRRLAELAGKIDKMGEFSGGPHFMYDDDGGSAHGAVDDLQHGGGSAGGNRGASRIPATGGRGGTQSTPRKRGSNGFDPRSIVDNGHNSGENNVSLAKTVENNCSIYQYAKNRASMDDKLSGIHAFTRKFVFLPNTGRRCLWDLWIMLLVVLYAFLVPVRVAFYKSSLYAAEEFIDWIADGLFFIDIILNFRTAYKDPNDIWVTSSGKIACNYLQTWFVVDFLSTFPIGALIQSPAADGRVQLGQASGDAKVSISTTSINKLIRLIRIVKLGRLFKLSNSMPALQRLRRRCDGLPLLTEVFKLLFVIFIIWHIIACSYWYIAVVVEYNFYAEMNCTTVGGLEEVFFYNDYCKWYGTCGLPGCGSLVPSNMTCIRRPIPTAEELSVPASHDAFMLWYDFAKWPWGSSHEMTGTPAAAHADKTEWFGVMPNIPAHCQRPLSMRNTWLPHPSFSFSHQSAQYAHAMGWAIQTTVGFGKTNPVSLTAYVFTTFVNIFGIFWYAVVIGYVTTTISAMGMSNARQLFKITKMQEFMKKNNVPISFRHIVYDYQQHIVNCPSDIPEGFSELPATLQHRLLLVIHWDLVRKVPKFKDLPGSVWVELMGVMRTANILPGEHIIRAGEMGTCMYFIKTGKVDIVDERYGRSRVVSMLKRGQFFGEVEVLNPGFRKASARAADYCTLLKLATGDFERICCDQETFRQDLELYSTTRHETLGLPPLLEGYEGASVPQQGDRSNMAIAANDLYSTNEVELELPVIDEESGAAGVKSFDGVESKRGNDVGVGDGSAGDESIAFRVVRYLHDWGGKSKAEV